MSVRFAIALLSATFPITNALAPAQEPVSARDFLTSVYRHYEKNGKGVSLTGKSGEDTFASSLRELALRDAEANGPDQVGVLDGDPVCACQDWEGIYNLSIDLEPVDASHSSAHVHFSLSQGKDERNLDLDLVRERESWRIWNIVDRTDPKSVFDLRAALEKDLHELEQNKKKQDVQ